SCRPLVGCGPLKASLVRREGFAPAVPIKPPVLTKRSRRLWAGPLGSSWTLLLIILAGGGVYVSTASRKDTLPLLAAFLLPGVAHAQAPQAPWRQASKASP
ncbi:MAG: hypothetical protein AABZ71_02920, partial [Candidatus Binatota bacterium]